MTVPAPPIQPSCAMPVKTVTENAMKAHAVVTALRPRASPVRCPVSTTASCGGTPPRRVSAMCARMWMA